MCFYKLKKEEYKKLKKEFETNNCAGSTLVLVYGLIIGLFLGMIATEIFNLFFSLLDKKEYTEVFFTTDYFIVLFAVIIFYMFYYTNLKKFYDENYKEKKIKNNNKK